MHYHYATTPKVCTWSRTRNLRTCNPPALPLCYTNETATRFELARPIGHRFSRRAPLTNEDSAVIVITGTRTQTPIMGRDLESRVATNFTMITKGLGRNRTASSRVTTASLHQQQDLQQTYEHWDSNPDSDVEQDPESCASTIPPCSFYDSRRSRTAPGQLATVPSSR